MGYEDILRVPDPTSDFGGMWLVPTPDRAIHVLDVLAETGADLGPVLDWWVANRDEFAALVAGKSPDEQAGCLAEAVRRVLEDTEPRDPLVALLLFSQL